MTEMAQTMADRKSYAHIVSLGSFCSTALEQENKGMKPFFAPGRHMLSDISESFDGETAGCTRQRGPL